MVGYHNMLQPTGLSESASHREHDAVAERHHGRLHVVISIMPFRYRVCTRKQRTLEILTHEGERNHKVLYPQKFTLPAGTFNFTRIMVGTIVKSNSERNPRLPVMKKRNRIHSARQNYY